MAREARTPKRTPVSEGHRNRLTVKGKDPAYEYYIVNDVDGRVEQFEAGGWIPVTDDDVSIGDKRVSVPTAPGSVKTIPVGGGVTGVLMKLPKELWEQDQISKSRRNKETTDMTMQEVKKASDYGDIKQTSTTS